MIPAEDEIVAAVIELASRRNPARAARG